MLKNIETKIFIKDLKTWNGISSLQCKTASEGTDLKGLELTSRILENNNK